MIAYEFDASNIKGNMIEIPEYMMSKISKYCKLTLTLDSLDEDEYLLALAEERLNDNRPTISQEQMRKKLGITQKDIDEAEADFD